MHIVGRSILVVAAAALLAAFALPADAATPTVAGRVTGKLPSSHKGVTNVRAFDANSAAEVAATTVGRTGTFRLALPPGAYLLETNVIPRHGGSRAGVERKIPLTLAPGQKRRAVKIAKPTARSTATRGPAAQPAFTQESGAIEPGSVAFSIENFTGATGNLAVFNRGLTDMLITDVIDAPCRHVIVANSGDRAVIGEELGLQKSHPEYFNPATRLTRNFIIPDIVVTGQLHTVGDGLSYVLTLTDGRTGTVLELIPGTFAGGDGVWDGEKQLAARLAKRVCAYGEVYEVAFTGTGIANFAIFSATGALNATTIEAKPTENDGQGATHWEGSAPLAWTDVELASKTPGCSYVDPVSGGTWTAKLARVGGALQILWIVDPGSTTMVTSVCPDSEGGEERLPGLAATALLDSNPNPFLLPADGVQHISGPGVDDQGYGWENNLDLKVRTVRVEPLG